MRVRVRAAARRPLPIVSAEGSSVAAAEPVGRCEPQTGPDESGDRGRRMRTRALRTMPPVQIAARAGSTTATTATPLTSPAPAALAPDRLRDLDELSPEDDVRLREASSDSATTCAPVERDLRDHNGSTATLEDALADAQMLWRQAETRLS